MAPQGAGKVIWEATEHHQIQVLLYRWENKAHGWEGHTGSVSWNRKNGRGMCYEQSQKTEAPQVLDAYPTHPGCFLPSSTETCLSPLETSSALPKPLPSTVPRACPQSPRPSFSPFLITFVLQHHGSSSLPLPPLSKVFLACVCSLEVRWCLPQ